MHRAATRRWCPFVPVACATVGTIVGLTTHGPAPAARAEDRPASVLPAGAIQLAAHQTGAAASAEELLDETVRLLEKGSSTAADRKAAVAALPLGRMTDSGRARTRQVLDQLSLFRQLPLVEFEVEPAVYRFFAAHPDVAVSIWRAMKISKFQMWQTGPNEYEADVGDGTVGIIDVLVRDPEQHVILCEGTYTSPFLAKPIQASALFHLQTRFVKNAAGRDLVQSRLTMFVAFPSQTVEAAARLVSPLSNVIIDRNFREVCLFVNMMTLAMQRQPGWVEQTAGRLDGVLEIRRTQLLDLCARVYVAARQREMSDVQQSHSAHDPRR